MKTLKGISLPLANLRRLCFHRCLSVHGGGVCLWSGECLPHPPGRHLMGRHPPIRRHPPLGTLPAGQTPPGHPSLGRHPLHSACWDTHLLPSAFWDTHPLPSACWDMVFNRVVCIPLECIRVQLIKILLYYSVHLPQKINNFYLKKHVTHSVNI